ncbi:PREDICTED: uncharacterized protein LOC109150220 [Ipomoea nil]|uniref:uncharacterized protein LOC109150220 n=1 Tax=Ipomoea nil TaxID=35883 RepID=UPI0009015A79|nr:PREDICTED: uncharacterized protein LOC109150220 [Ipomoea nil]
MHEEFLHLKQGAATITEYHKRFLELARFALELVPTESTKIERFVSGLNFEAQKALIVSGPRTLNEAYSSAANLYRIQLLQHEVQDQIRKRNTGGGAPPMKRTRTDTNTRPNNPAGQRAPLRNNEANAGGFPCPRCNQSHRGRDCMGNPLRCFNCGKEGHKAFHYSQPSSSRPINMGQHGGTNNQGNRSATGKVFVMSRTQAELVNEDTLNEENMTPEDEDHANPPEENQEDEFCLG